MLAGGGIRGGQVWGATDEEGREVVDGITQIQTSMLLLLALGLLSYEYVLLRVDLSPLQTRSSLLSCFKAQFLCKLVSEAIGLDLFNRPPWMEPFNQIINLLL